MRTLNILLQLETYASVYCVHHLFTICALMPLVQAHCAQCASLCDKCVSRDGHINSGAHHPQTIISSLHARGLASHLHPSHAHRVSLVLKTF